MFQFNKNICAYTDMCHSFSWWLYPQGSRFTAEERVCFASRLWYWRLQNHLWLVHCRLSYSGLLLVFVILLWHSIIH